jgi:hypothetical protein
MRTLNILETGERARGLTATSVAAVLDLSRRGTTFTLSYRLAVRCDINDGNQLKRHGSFFKSVTNLVRIANRITYRLIISFNKLYFYITLEIKMLNFDGKYFSLYRAVFFSYSCCSHFEYRTSVKRFVTLQFFNLSRSVGLLGRGMSPSQGRYITQTQNKHKQTSGRRHFMP